MQFHLRQHCLEIEYLLPVSQTDYCELLGVTAAGLIVGGLQPKGISKQITFLMHL